MKRITTERGFTLIELMITLVIAMVILGGLLLNFTSQSTQYKYQGKRGDAVQDLEFTLRFIARDIQGALISASSLEASGAGVASIKFDGSATSSSTWLSMNVWDNSASAANDYQAVRCYRYRGGTGTASTQWKLYFNRDNSACSATVGLVGFDPVLGETTGMRVTNFRVFRDGATGDGRASYSGVPPALPPKFVGDVQGNTYNIPAFTVLLEIEIDAANKGAVVDVLGAALPAGSKRRIWRYVQVYPNTVFD
ncbi:prepilin-type N-terminal cleavage/methylation domain-containing protein [Ghiorsea bivora]|uniref:prepilin-type N-terminal cleavage/methylation domain-containing protein n=1 Tax=Ghiorsea bivora TaxID=1485545 RepID=UPI000570562D|nr:prepilin-type N-terminal cleavage/methylation domain-containing protein [Ghiorsea bivora]